MKAKNEYDKASYERLALQNEQLAPVAKGSYDLRVDMYFLGTYVGSALVKRCWSNRSARLAALRGISTSIYPMSDRDSVTFISEKRR